MTIVVSDTGPLNYLVLIEAIDLLPRIFDQVIVPDQVLVELNHERTPELVRKWLKALPGWISVETSDVEIAELASVARRVEKGELSAMAVGEVAGFA